MLLSVIYEKNVVFVSTSPFEITAAISTFISLLRPFKWSYPVIYNIPGDCLEILGSPIPVLVGLNLPAKKVLEYVIPTHGKLVHKESVYVFLDQNLIYYDFDMLEEFSIPSYEDFHHKLKAIYHKNFSKKNSAYFSVKKRHSKG